jgi:hypothetical protein
MASSISSKVVSYQKSLQKIQQRHQTWVQNTKPFLLELLEKTLKENPMDWYLGMK